MRAFPSAIPADEATSQDEEGMLLRDWFAGQTLMGLTACPETLGTWSEFAKWSYEAADAMLTERLKTATPKE